MPSPTLPNLILENMNYPLMWTNQVGYKGDMRFSWNWSPFRFMPMINNKRYNLFVYDVMRHIRRLVELDAITNPELYTTAFFWTSQYIPQKTQRLVQTVASSFNMIFQHGKADPNTGSITGGAFWVEVSYDIPENYPPYLNGLEKDAYGRKYRHNNELQWGEKTASMDIAYTGLLKSRGIRWYPQSTPDAESYDEDTNTFEPTAIDKWLGRKSTRYLCYDVNALTHWGIILRHNMFIAAGSRVSMALNIFNNQVREEIVKRAMAGQDAPVNLLGIDCVTMHTKIQSSNAWQG